MDCGLYQCFLERNSVQMVSKKNDLENSVESYLRKQVEKRGGKCIKFLPDFSRGFPDRIVILPNSFLCWVETKRPEGGRLSGSQNVQHALLRRLGQRVEIIWTKEEVDTFLRAVGYDMGAHEENTKETRSTYASPHAE